MTAIMKVIEKNTSNCEKENQSRSEKMRKRLSSQVQATLSDLADR
jgi:hypothetical protein